jgi:hypothetical protein
MHQAKGGTSRTTDYYEINAFEYFGKTVLVDPSSFLLPLAGELDQKVSRFMKKKPKQPPCTITSEKQHLVNQFDMLGDG